VTSVTVPNLVIRSSCQPSIGLAALISNFLHRMSNRVTNVRIGEESYLRPLNKLSFHFTDFLETYRHLMKFFEHVLFRIVCKSDGSVENVGKISLTVLNRVRH
jgi:hypothetical protein